MMWLFVFALNASADMKWGFADVSVKYLDWNRQTEEKSPKRDFTYLELEGGGQLSWGELYGFFDVENPGQTGKDVRTAAKGSISYYLGTSGLTLYAQVYNFAMAGFYDQNRVMGLGYSFQRESWWFKPFLGFHEVSQTYYNGSNGYMGGWVAGKFLSWGTAKFLIADWHEIEFMRNENYARGNGGKRESHNGALSAWWIANRNYTLGVQWRYATDKLGTAGAVGAVIYTLKYVF